MTVTSASATLGASEWSTETIWREFGAQLRGFVHSRIADPERADDVLGEIVLRIHAHRKRVEDDEHLTRWLYRVARNAIVDDYRRAARERGRLEPLSGQESEIAPDPWDEDHSSALRELAACMRPLLHGLSPEQRRAVELTDFEGMTQTAAAGLEKISVSGMKSRVQRGRQRLAELLNQCCELTLDARGIPMDYTASSDCGCATCSS